MAARGWKRADVVRISQMSSSVVSQWLGKGNKQIKTIRALPAALRLAEASGYSAQWIAMGIGPRFTPTPVPPRPPGNVHHLSTGDDTLRAVETLSRLLARVPAERRAVVASALSGWAMDGGAEHWRLVVTSLLEPGKPPAAAA